MWVSSAVLAPLGVMLTVKANNDSVVFNADAYVMFFRKVLGVQQKRHIVRKEVIIHDPDYEEMRLRLADIARKAQHYRRTHKRLWQVQLMLLMLKGRRDDDVEQLCNELEYCVEELSNSKDRQILQLLNQLPVPHRAARFTNILRKEMKMISRTSDQIIKRINEIYDTV